MAGRGSRLRPHTLTIPKPLVPVGGKPIVHRLVADIARVCAEPIEEIAFVVGEFGEAVEKELLAVAESLGAKGSIHYQLQALGTAHAVLCAAEALDGPVVVAFADTLFKADFKISKEDEGILAKEEVEALLSENGKSWQQTSETEWSNEQCSAKVWGKYLVIVNKDYQKQIDAKRQVDWFKANTPGENRTHI